MKRLLLLRHAKSSWDNPSLKDRERPLAKRGMRDAPRVGRYLLQKEYVPDLVLSSPSRRTRETLELLLPALQVQPPVLFDERLYAEDVQGVRRLIAELPEVHECILVVGHFPDIQTLAEEMTAAPFSFGKYSTCAVTVIEFPGRDWALTLGGHGIIAHFVRPKDLA